MGVMTRMGEELRTLALAVGLVGCNSCNIIPAECRTYNDETIILNQDTDGVVSDFVELQPSAGEIISPVMIDLINEARALSGHLLPEDLHLTSVPSSCVQGHWYSLTRDKDIGPYTEQRGIYIKEPVTPILLRKLLHEIGHFDRDNVGEITAELNVMQQFLTGYALMASQRNSSVQGIQWGWLAMSEVLGSYLSNSEYDATNRYTRADIFLVQQLKVLEGDFTTLRQRLHELKENGQLEDAIKQSVEEFQNTYGESPVQGHILQRDADMILDASRNSYLELERQYGKEVSTAYFNAVNHFNGSNIIISQIFPDQPRPPMSWVLSFGLEEYVCKAFVNRFDDEIVCEPGKKKCDELGATNLRHYRKSLCCDSIERTTRDKVEFRRWFIDAGGDLYRGTEERPLHIPQLGLEWPYAVEFLRIYEKRELAEGEACVDI